MTHPIIVTGPQRAGSRLASHIIARDTNRTFIDEVDYTPDIPDYAVVQAPFLLKNVLELSFLLPTAQFAFMIRDKADIITSMERVEWYKDYITTSKFYKAYVDHCYDYINLLQFTLPKHRWFNIYYNSLVDDPLFVKDRANFTTKQHLPNKPNGPKTWRNDEYLRST